MILRPSAAQVRASRHAIPSLICQLSSSCVRLASGPSDWLSVSPRSADVRQLRPEVVVSTSLDPIFNLALEERLLRSRGSRIPKGTEQNEAEHCAPTLYIYRNAPCLVLGRNQNPWVETNPRVMHATSPPIQLVRRRSGGGAVYHDQGNSNYSIHLPKEQFDRSTQAQLVARALNSAPMNLYGQRGIAANATNDASPEQWKYLPRGVYANERNDLCVSLISPKAQQAEAQAIAAGEASSPTDDLEHDQQTVTVRKPFEYKISGSAYKLTSSRAYHHGTMLLSAQLEHLGNSLRSPLLNGPYAAITSKGVSSVRAPVTSLAQAFPQTVGQLPDAHDAFVRAVSTEFLRSNGLSKVSAAGQIHEVDTDLLQTDESLREIYQDLSKWEWIFGQTPEFTLVLNVPPSTDAEPTHPSWLLGLEMHLTIRQGKVQSVQLQRLVLSDTLEPVLAHDLSEWFTHDLVGIPFDALVIPPPLPYCFAPLPPTELVAPTGTRLDTLKREWLEWVKQVL